MFINKLFCSGGPHTGSLTQVVQAISNCSIYSAKAQTQRSKGQMETNGDRNVNNLRTVIIHHLD